MNPRAADGFAEAVDAADAIHARVVASTVHEPPPRPHPVRRRFVGVSTAAGVALAAAAVTAFLTIGSSGTGPGPANAAAAVRKAVTVTAASAERSGTAVVTITHGGGTWATKTVRWNGDDVEIDGDATPRSLLVVDGMMYAPDPEGPGWIELGPPQSIDPGSGTTPAEYLAAVREDVGGVTLRRITDGMRGLTSASLDDGSTVYRGTVASGLIARESGFKEGHAIRVLPFGYVAHDEAADASSQLDTSITVGVGGAISVIAVSWGTWRYTVTYSGLGSTPAPVAPPHAKPLRRG